MKIDDDHLYYGAALLQIVEDASFKKIEAIPLHGSHRKAVAWLVNNKTIVVPRYRTEPSIRHGKERQYSFAFNRDTIKELRGIAKKKRLLLALLCVKDRWIATLPFSEFETMVSLRKRAKHEEEESYTLVVYRPGKGTRLRVGIDEPGSKRRFLHYEAVAQDDFPHNVFSAPT